MRACWNRQTGKLEVLVFEWTCGFKSHRSHQIWTLILIQCIRVGVHIIFHSRLKIGAYLNSFYRILHTITEKNTS